MTVHVIIRPCTVAEVEASGAQHELVESYAIESNIQELGEVEACFETYRAMEASGALHVIGVFAPELVGLASLVVYGLPHYKGRRICAMESFFVAPHARKGGTGMKLLGAAEEHAKTLGATAMMVSAPVNSRLAKVLPRSRYRETNRVFLKVLT